MQSQQLCSQPDHPLQPLNSSAFPPEKPVQKESVFHRILAQAHQIPQSFKIRPFAVSDLYEFRNLQLEWFPLRYGDYFYYRLLNRHYQCILAETEVTILASKLKVILEEQQTIFNNNKAQIKNKESLWMQKSQYFEVQGINLTSLSQGHEQVKVKIIIGALVYELTHSKGYLGNVWWSQTVMAQSNSLYISTLGVIEQFRKKKTAQKLLNRCMMGVEENEQIKLILLHVIDYNQAAIRLYQKNDFQILQKLNNFYNVDGKPYDGIAMGKFMNGGTRKLTWSAWIRSFW